MVAPEPPADLHSISLPLLAAPRSTWYRLNNRIHRSPLFWSRRGVFRFDSASAKWGVLYAAESLTAAVQEIWSDAARWQPAIDWSEFDAVDAWEIRMPSGLNVLELAGPNLTTIRATLQCFVGAYAKSQRWAAALMEHPDDLDALQYLGRRCGRPCLALLGDNKKMRGYQSRQQVSKLGPLVNWNRFFASAHRLRFRLGNLPTVKPPGLFDAP